MNEFVEKLAETLVNSWRQDSWANQTEIGKENARSSVRAVLAVMREPTEAMLIDGACAASFEGDVRGIWKSMIDAALEETK